MVAGGFSERPVLHYENKSWTYGDLLTLSNQIARVLIEDCGMVTGARVLLRAANTPMLVACWFAVLKAGGICVTTMPLLRARELAYLIDRAGVTIALSDVALTDELEEAAASSPELRNLLYFTAMADGGSKATLETAMDEKQSDFTNVNTAADDIALIGFTSGTTGNPKGTVHYHRDLMAITDCFPRYVGKITPDDVITGTPPLAFTFGLGGVTLFPMRFGASTRFSRRADPKPYSKPSTNTMLPKPTRHQRRSGRWPTSWINTICPLYDRASLPERPSLRRPGRLFTRQPALG